MITQRNVGSVGHITHGLREEPVEERAKAEGGICHIKGLQINEKNTKLM